MVTPESISVGVAHPEALAAEGIAAALGRYPGIVPVGIATSRSGAHELGVCAQALVVHRDLLAGPSALSHRGVGAPRVIVIGWPANVGGRGPAGLDELATMIRPVRSGPEGDVPRLTRREAQVLALVADGMAGKQVARRLGISPKTVERHKTRIYSKLGVPNQAAAAGFAVRHQRTIGEVAWN